MANASASLLQSTLDLRLSEVSFTTDRLVVRSTPGLVRRTLAAVLALPFLSMTFDALRHPDAMMIGLSLLVGVVTLPFVLLVGAAVHEKSFSREGLRNTLRVFGWSTEERSQVPPGATIVVRAATARGGRRFSVSVARCDGMNVSVLNDEAAAVELARRLAGLLGLSMENAASSHP